MADGESSWRGQQDTNNLPDEISFSPTREEFCIADYRPRPPNRDSTGTSSQSRRESYYDFQRGGDAGSTTAGRSRSRPTSTASVLTTCTTTAGGTRSRSKGKQRERERVLRTTSEPLDIARLGEALHDTHDDRPIGDESGGDQHQGPGMHVRNFSRISAGARRKTNETDYQDEQQQQQQLHTLHLQNFADWSALPPLPYKNNNTNNNNNNNRLSAATTARPNTQPTKRSEDLGPRDAADSSEIPRLFNSRRRTTEELFARPVDPVPRWLTEFYTISYLIFFSIWGTLARLGIQWLTFYPGAPIITPVIWANMAGSWLMGFLSEDQNLFLNHHLSSTTGGGRGGGSEKNHQHHNIPKATLNKYKKTIPLYIGLTTGFCGSFTSFSSFARDFFLALSNNLPSPISHSGAGENNNTPSPSPSSTIGRNAGYSVQALLAIILSTLALSLGAYIIGLHTASLFANLQFPPKKSLPTSLIRKFLDPLFIFLGWGCWIGAIILSALPPDSTHHNNNNNTWRGQALFALIFAPLGTLLRFYVSLRMNSLIAWFPLGTFAVNMFGTAIEGMCYDLQHVGIGSNSHLRPLLQHIGGGRTACQILQGVMDGFCGCLTTVSTWVGEIYGLSSLLQKDDDDDDDGKKKRNLKFAYLYGGASIAGGLGLMVVIMGSVRWSVGFEEAVCNTGYPNKVHAG